MQSHTVLRTFVWDDLDNLVAAYNRVQRTTASETSMRSTWMRAMLSVPGMDPEDNCILAERDGTIVGFALLTPEPIINRVVAVIGIVPEERGLGLGNRLIGDATDHTKLLGIRNFQTEEPANSWIATNLLEDHGFEQVRTFWKMSWEPTDVPYETIPSGLKIRLFEPERDEMALTKLQNTCFEGSWGFSPNTVEQIAARVRFEQVESAGIVLATDGAKLVGYNWTSCTSQRPSAIGRIEMTGVHPDYRGYGLGRFIVRAGMDLLRRAGVSSVVLDVDSANRPAKLIYIFNGFRKVSETIWYQKILEV